MNLRELAQLEAVLKYLHRDIGKRLETVRADVQAAIDAADKTTGVRQVAAELPDGVTVAKISLTAPGPEAAVTDAKAFVAWVRTAYPDEIDPRMVVAVRDAFTTKLLAEITASGTPCDPETGEVVPGVEMRERTRTHALRFATNGADLIARAWRAGELAHLVLAPADSGTAATSAAEIA